MKSRQYSPGDWVIYRKPKRSTAPGHRARDIVPATHGDTYSYMVDKFWVVRESLADGTLKVQTRRGKLHTLKSEDPNLRHASWWQRLLYGHRFRAIERDQ